MGSPPAAVLPGAIAPDTPEFAEGLAAPAWAPPPGGDDRTVPRSTAGARRRTPTPTLSRSRLTVPLHPATTPAWPVPGAHRPLVTARGAR